MDELIQKYLDGELSDGEAETLSRELATNAELDAELKSFERMLALAAASNKVAAAPDFTDVVMDRIAAGAGRKVRPAARDRSRRWLPRLAWAAGFAAVFILGFATAGRFVSQPPGRGTTDGAPTAVAGLNADNPVMQSSGDNRYRVVRLVYVPQGADVKSVSVAGTFNGWDPAATEMRREGNVWVVELLLPPETYEYMFIENGDQWVTDPLAVQTRDDGFGRRNAVLDLTI